MSEDQAAPKGSPKAKGKPPLAMILLLVNFLVLGAALIVLVKTKILYKRPEITEESERKRLEAQASATPKTATQNGVVAFEPVTANIAVVNGKPHFATIGFSLEIRDSSRSSDIEAVRALIMDSLLGILAKKQPHDLDNVQGRFVLRTEIIEMSNKTIFENAGKIKAPPASATPATGGEHGAGGEHAAPAAGEHGEGGGEHGGGEHEAAAPKAGASEEHKAPIKDLVTNVYFTQFIVQ